MKRTLYTDLDIDSIDAVDLAVKLKQLTGKRLQPEVFKSVRTVQDVVERSRRPAREIAGASPLNVMRPCQS